jgi:hypothetical protein
VEVSDLETVQPFELFLIVTVPAFKLDAV